MGSVSKILARPAGWLDTCLDQLITRLARLKVTDDLGSAHASQLLTVRLLSQLDTMAARYRTIDALLLLDPAGETTAH